MRKTLCFAVLALVAIAAIPNSGEAFGRRGRRCQCPPACVVWCEPSCGDCCQPCYPGQTQGGPSGSVPTHFDAAESAAIPERNVIIRNKSYRIKFRAETTEVEEEPPTPLTASPSGAGSTIPAKDQFRGTARRIAKTTIFSGPVQTYATVSALLDSLPANETMLDMHIPHTATTNRVDVEKKSVSVQGYIYAFTKEADNDYHVILGDAPGSANVRYMNTEVSGIPIAGTDENRNTLWDVRHQFEQQFSLDGSWHTSGYFFPNPPVPVRFTGSLFWDVDHEHPPYVGPTSNKPQSAWEVHPISSIEFLDN